MGLSCRERLSSLSSSSSGGSDSCCCHKACCLALMQTGQGTALLTSDLQREQELPRIAAAATVLLLHIQFFMPNAAVVLQQHAAQTHSHT